MVDKWDPNQFSGSCDMFCNFDIGFTWGGDSRWMVVGEYHRRRTMLNCRLEYFTRVDDVCIDCPNRNCFHVYDAVMGIEIDPA
jgi:hypothetical protein